MISPHAQQLQTLVTQSWVWLKEHILSIQTAMQAAAIGGCVLLSWLVFTPLVRRLRDQAAVYDGQGLVLAAVVLRTVTRLILPMGLVLALNLVEMGLIATGHGFKLLDVAEALIVAWVLVQLVSSFIVSRFWARVISIGLWFVAALDIVGLFDMLETFLGGVGMTFGDTYISALAIIKGGVLMVLLVQGAGFLSGLADRALQNSSAVTPSAKVLFAKAARFGLFAAAVLVAMSAVGIDLTSFAVFSGAVGVGIGFGLQKVFSNLVSGVILLMDKSIKPGDTIEVGGVYGLVTSFNARYTSVLTRDGKEYLVPNETFVTNEVVNWTHGDPNVRLRIPVGVSYDADLHLVRKLLEEAAGKAKRVLNNPEPRVLLRGFGDSSVNFEVRVWINDAEQGIGAVQSEVLFLVWDLFKEHGIEIPFPQRDLNIRTLPEREELAKVLRSGAGERPEQPGDPDQPEESGPDRKSATVEAG